QPVFGGASAGAGIDHAKFGPIGRNFSTSSIGQAWRGLMASPSDRLSPNTKMVFICDGSVARAQPGFAQNSENSSAATTLLRHCLQRFRIFNGDIYHPGCYHSW